MSAPDLQEQIATLRIALQLISQQRNNLADQLVNTATELELAKQKMLSQREQIVLLEAKVTNFETKI